MNDFKNLNILQICSIRTYIHYVCPHFVYRKKNFWGRKEGFYYVLGLGSGKYITKGEIEENLELYCDGEKVYYKPHIEIRMSNGDIHEKFFETKEEFIKFTQLIEPISGVKWVNIL